GSAIHAANGTLNGRWHPTVQQIRVEGVLLAATADDFDGYHENDPRMAAATPGGTKSNARNGGRAVFTIKKIFVRRAAGHPTITWRARRRVHQNFYSPRPPKS